jgi:hypothetical protein
MEGIHALKYVASSRIPIVVQVRRGEERRGDGRRYSWYARQKHVDAHCGLHNISYYMC